MNIYHWRVFIRILSDEEMEDVDTFARMFGRRLAKAFEENKVDQEMIKMISDFKKHPTKFKKSISPKIPDGSPIGNN